MQVETIGSAIPAMSDAAMGKVCDLETMILSLPQVDIDHTHTLHDGVYTRTIFMAAGVILTGALIKIPTTLIISGHVVAYFGDTTLTVAGYKVIKAEARRKTAFVAIGDTWLTMLFATEAQTIEEAEEQFTDEYDRLMTRREQ